VLRAASTSRHDRLDAFRLVWRVDGVFYTYGVRWVPTDAVAQRTERGTVPYAAWVESKLIKQTDGDVTDYAVIEADIKELCERFNPSEIAYDRGTRSTSCNRLTEANLPMVEFIQGPKSYHPAMQALELAYGAGKLAHGGDPVLVVRGEHRSALRREHEHGAGQEAGAEKIDDMAALLMGIGRMLGGAGESFWQRAA
jgi:phage terminase large subunit-like protein